MKSLFRKGNLLCVKVSNPWLVPNSKYLCQYIRVWRISPSPILLTTCLNNHFLFIGCVTFFQVLIVSYKEEFRESYIFKIGNIFRWYRIWMVLESIVKSKCFSNPSPVTQFPSSEIIAIVSYLFPSREMHVWAYRCKITLWNFILSLILIIIFNWSITGMQYSIGFRCTS